MSQDLTGADIARRMTAAGKTEEKGDFRKAAHLYNQLGKDIQAERGRFDGHALDAFEGLARANSKAGSGQRPDPPRTRTHAGLRQQGRPHVGFEVEMFRKIADAQNRGDHDEAEKLIAYTYRETAMSPDDLTAEVYRYFRNN